MNILKQKVYELKYINKTIFFLLLTVCSNSYSAQSETKMIAEFEDSETYRIKFMSSENLQKLGLYYDKEGFYIVHDDKIIDIERCNLDPELRNITDEQLKLLVSNGYITLKQIADDEFVLRANVKGLGGGPILAFVGGLVTRVLGVGMVISASRDTDTEGNRRIRGGLSDMRDMDDLLRRDLRSIAKNNLRSQASNFVADEIDRNGFRDQAKEGTCAILAAGTALAPIEVVARGVEGLLMVLPTP